MTDTPKIVGFVSDPAEIWDSFASYSGDLAFDVGANGGMTARIFAPNFGRVVAFEPCRDSFACLVADCAPNVVPVPLAVADTVGPLTLESTDVLKSMGELKLGGSMQQIWGETTSSVTVPAVTLDVCAAVFGFPDFVKIDTEGSEWLIVQGAREVFARRPRFVIEVHSEQNGVLIQAKVGGRIVRHPAYPPPTQLYRQHFYLVGDR